MTTPFRICLNTSTLRGHKLPLTELIALTARAGYDGIEPWIDEIDAYLAGGGSLPELKSRIADAGLTVEGAIGFFEWIVDDGTTRQKGLDEARRNMELVRGIGGTRFAAPPWGAHDQPGPALLTMADRYRTLLEIGEQEGVTPLLEVWGFSQTLSRLGEAVGVAMESGRPDAALLLDVYHLYKGGSGHTGLSLLNGKAIGLFHVNDYPAMLSPAAITDADRVYPGDGGG